MFPAGLSTLLVDGRLQTMQLIVEDPSLSRVLGAHVPRPVIPQQATTARSCPSTTDEALAPEMQYPTSNEHPSIHPSTSHNCSAGLCPVSEQQRSLVLYLQGLHNKCQLMIPPRPRPLTSYDAVPQSTLTPVYLTPPHLRDTLQPSITELQTVPESPPRSRPTSATPSALLSQPLQSQCEDREQLVQESDDEIDMPAVPTTPIHSQILTSYSQSPFYEAEHKQTDSSSPHLPQSQTLCGGKIIPCSLEAPHRLLSPDPGAEGHTPAQKKARLCNDPLSNSNGDDEAEAAAEVPASLHQSLTSHDACGTTDHTALTAERGTEGEELSTERADDGSSTLDQAVPCESAREHALVANLVPCNVRGGRGPDEGGGDGDQEHVLTAVCEVDQQTAVCEVDQQTVACEVDQQTVACEADQQIEVDQIGEYEVEEEQQLVPCGPDDGGEEDSPSHSLPLTSLYEEQHGRDTLDKLSTCEEITSRQPRPWSHRDTLHHSHYSSTYHLSRPTTTTTICSCNSRGERNTHSYCTRWLIHSMLSFLPSE